MELAGGNRTGKHFLRLISNHAHSRIFLSINPMQLPDVPNLLVLDPGVALVLIDQPRFDSGSARSYDIDRVDVACKFSLVGSDAKPFECDLKDPWVRLRDADDMRVDDLVEVIRQPESFRIPSDLPLRIRHDRKFVARRLERFERLEGAGPHDAPERGLAMYRAELYRALLKFLFRDSRRRHPAAKKMLIRGVVGLRFRRAHQVSIDRRAPRVLRMLERKWIELAPFTREFTSEQLEIEKRQRAAKVEQQRLQSFVFCSTHSATV